MSQSLSCSGCGNVVGKVFVDLPATCDALRGSLCLDTKKLQRSAAESYVPDFVLQVTNPSSMVNSGLWQSYATVSTERPALNCQHSLYSLQLRTKGSVQALNDCFAGNASYEIGQSELLYSNKLPQPNPQGPGNDALALAPSPHCQAPIDDSLPQKVAALEAELTKVWPFRQAVFLLSI